MCVFVTYRCGVHGQVWYFIVSIPDLCFLTYVCFLTENNTGIHKTKRMHMLICVIIMFINKTFLQDKLIMPNDNKDKNA